MTFLRLPIRRHALLRYGALWQWYAKGIGGGLRRRVTCGWYAKNLLRVYARMWVSAVYFSVGEAWKARRRERTLSA